MTYGELTAGKRLAGRVTGDAAARARWALRGTAGQESQRPRLRDGRARVHARPRASRTCCSACVVRPPAYGATLRAVDDRAARAMAGVTVVRDGEFLGVVAPDRSRGARAPRRRSSASGARRPRSPTPTPSTNTSRRRRAAAAEAERGGGATVTRATSGGPRAAPPASSTRAIAFRTSRTCRSSRARPSPNGPTARSPSGPARSGRSASAPKSRARSRSPRIACASSCPTWARATAASTPANRPIEAARLARAAKRPVKLVYRRDEEFSWGYFRPAGVIDIKAGVDASGRLTSLGVRQLELRQFRPRDAVRRRQTSARRFTPSIRRCGRAPTVGLRRRPITTRARCTWTPSRARSASTRSTSV